MYRLAAEQKGVVIAENLSYLEKLHVGDFVELPSPAGPIRLPVLGVVRDYANQLGLHLHGP